MPKQVNWISEVALFLAGGLLAASVRRVRSPLHCPCAGETGQERPDVSEICTALCQLERRLTKEASTTDIRLAAIEARIEEHSAKLAEIPAIQQIVSAIEQTLTKAIAPIHERLSGQDQAMTSLKAAVGRSDRLIDRVLELAKETREDTNHAAV
jgi:ATP-dependent Clp protease ATP-binding subunit ClpA